MKYKVNLYEVVRVAERCNKDNCRINLNENNQTIATLYLKRAEIEDLIATHIMFDRAVDSISLKDNLIEVNFKPKENESGL